MHSKPVAVVTGANKGIGLQIAMDLAAHGLTVLVASRSLKNGETAAKSVAADAATPSRSARRTHRQPIELGRLAHAKLGLEEPAPFDVRRLLLI